MISVFCPCQWWVSKNKLDVWVGGVRSVQFFWIFFNFAKPLRFIHVIIDTPAVSLFAAVWSCCLDANLVKYCYNYEKRRELPEDTGIGNGWYDRENVTSATVLVGRLSTRIVHFVKKAWNFAQVFFSTYRSLKKIDPKNLRPLVAAILISNMAPKWP